MTTPGPTGFFELAPYRTPHRKFFAKMESENPTGSLKDRMVRRTLELYEEHDNVKPGDMIVEASSGNTGIALARVCRELGYGCTICLSSIISEYKKQAIRELGATVVETDSSKNREAEIVLADEMGKLPGHFWFNQFDNPHHIQAYADSLGAELLLQLEQTGVKLDALVAGVGTGASLLGTATKLRAEHNPELKVYAVSPTESPTAIEGLNPDRQRGDFAIWKGRPPGFETARIYIDDEPAINQARELKENHNISVGPCSGAILHVARHKISDIPENGGNYLLLFSDNGNRYSKMY